MAKVETMLSEFDTVEALESWLEDRARAWIVDRRIHAQLETAARAMAEAARLGFAKDYVVSLEVRCFLTRKGPQRPGRLVRQRRELEEQWRASRASGSEGDAEPGGDG